MNYFLSVLFFFFIWFGFLSVIKALSLQTFLIFFHCLFFHTNGNNYMLFSQESFFSLWHTHMLVFLPQVLCCFTSFPTFHFPLSFTKMYKDPSACTPEKLWFSLLCRTFTPLIEEKPLVVPEESRQGCLYCREGRDYRNHLSQAFDVTPTPSHRCLYLTDEALHDLHPWQLHLDLPRQCQWLPQGPVVPSCCWFSWLPAPSSHPACSIHGHQPEEAGN